MLRKRALLIAVVALLGAALATVGVLAHNDRWATHLAGRFELPVRDTHAQGQATFKLSDDGEELHYKLISANIENVFQAHIHCGTPDVNGPVVVWLYPSTAPGAGLPGQGRTNGVLAEGTITDANVIARAPNVCPGGVDDLADVIALLQNGGAYVNIHTSDGVEPANTGPGDFPGGEIRGNLHGDGQGADNH